MTNGEGEKTKADCLQQEDVEIPKLTESTLNSRYLVNIEVLV